MVYDDVKSTETIRNNLIDFERRAEFLNLFKCEFNCNGTRVYGGDTLFELCPSSGPVDIVVDRFDQPNRPPRSYDESNRFFYSRLQQRFFRLKRGENNYWIQLLWPVDEDNNISNDNTNAAGETDDDIPLVELLNRYDSGEEDEEKEEQEEEKE